MRGQRERRRVRWERGEERADNRRMGEETRWTINAMMHRGDGIGKK